ncbi:MAG TPA: Hsp70 family protein [Chthoniobacterales bacterium]|nr:Hsp70 family protein [Chthoniobacterales bacterium]
MAQPEFSIGIDLGTTNCAMAFESLQSAASERELFLIPQWEAVSRFSEARTLPSFLYFSSSEEAAQISGDRSHTEEWIPGRFARSRAADLPGRVVHSAKSWLCHHSADRTAKFLPWRSDEIPVEKRISPIRASALLLSYLRAAWDARFAERGARFEDQEITVTVPASFDAAAQKLTLEAATEAGYPAGVRLLEEPQAVFYWWLESGPETDQILQRLTPAGVSHVLVVDIGGGTTDFTLFEVSPESGSAIAHIKRVAVSDHLLLGGDNIDLAIAHHVESRLSAHERLSEVQWNFLVARCRDVKERCLGENSSRVYTVTVPAVGSRLLGGTLTAQIDRTEIESIVLDGFFPKCNRTDLPNRSQAGLREWALPYATDSAITRYLAEFLNGRPRVDAILFNGGTLYPNALRERLRKQITEWQSDTEPVLLDNFEPSLAVAKGAAHFGAIVHLHNQRIEAGAARAIYLEVHKANRENDRGAARTLICILPSGAPAEEEFRVQQNGLELRVNRPVKFQPFYSTRRNRDRAGSLVQWNKEEFHELPPLKTTARFSGPAPEGNRLPIALVTRMNELGLLNVACVSADADLPGTWPLDFDLRPQAFERANPQIQRMSDTPVKLGVDSDRLAAAQARIKTQFSRSLDLRDKISATNLLKSLERILGKAKSDWDYHLIRSLWRPVDEAFEDRQKSVEHEETWLILAGYFLRPGFGVKGDDSMIDALWRVYTRGLHYPGKRNQLQAYILWRRVSGGLDRERQEVILAPELPRIRAQSNLPAELVRLVGSLERIEPDTKTELLARLLESAGQKIREKQHVAPYLVALGLLVNRSPLYAGPEFVLPASNVEKLFDEFSRLDWADPLLLEIQNLFLRAARITDDPRIDLPKSLRDRIVSKLQKAGVAPAKIAKLRSFVPVAASDRASLFGEALPPGLVIAGS